MPCTRFRFLIQHRLLLEGFATGVLILGAMLLLWMQPRWLLSTLSPAICPDAIYYVDTDRLVVALTVDDGPDNQHTGGANNTQKIVDILARYQAKATFS